MNDAIYPSPSPAEPPAEDPAYHVPAARKAYSRVGLGMLLFLIVPQLVSVPVVLLLSFLFPALSESGWLVWINQVFSMYMVAAPICLLVIGLPPADLPAREKQTMSFSRLFILFCIAEFVSVAGSLISQLLMSAVTAITGSTPVSPLDEMLTGSPLWVILLVVVIIGPIIEELVCRRAIMNRMLPYGEKSAILLSALYFGIIHGNFYQLFYTVGFGILLGYVYARTNRLSYVCGLHILFNFLGSFVPMWLMGDMDLSILETMDMAEYAAWIEANLLPYLGLLFYELVIWGFAIAGFVLLVLYWRRAKFSPSACPLPKKGRSAVYFGNAGMILFMIFGVLQLLLSIFSY